MVEGEGRVAEAAARLALLGGSAAEGRLREHYLDLLAPLPGELVVDVGAGIGVVTAAIARRVAPGGRVFAVDRSAGLLEKARSFTRQAGFGHLVDCRVADARELPYGPAACDAAFCHWLLGHVSRPHEVIAEMKRVTRRGGRVLAVEADWGTAMVEPGDTDVTRRILDFAADRHLDAWVGRRIPNLFTESDLIHVAIEPMVLIDRGEDDRAWLTFLKERATLAVSGGAVTQREATLWTRELDQAFEAGTFLFALTHFAALGQVPI